MHLKDEDWKVYDVAIDGVSLVLNYRNDFRSQVRQKGIEALIERLLEHNQTKTYE